MTPSDLLTLIVEASVALAGFAGIVGAIGQGGNFSPLMTHELSLVNLLSTSFGALFMSLTALALLVAGVDESLTWRFSSALSLIVTLFFTLRAYRTISRVGEAQSTFRSLRKLSILSILATCGLQAWNALYLGQFWPLFVLLIALFAIACAAFTRLVFALDVPRHAEVEPPMRANDADQ